MDADERPLSCMYTLVSDEIAGIRESLPAQRTTVRFDPCVNRLVFPQIAGLAKPFPTMRAAIWFLPRVNPLVSLKISLTCETLPAKATNKLPFLVAPGMHLMSCGRHDSLGDRQSTTSSVLSLALSIARKMPPAYVPKAVMPRQTSLHLMQQCISIRLRILMVGFRIQSDNLWFNRVQFDRKQLLPCTFLIY